MKTNWGNFNFSEYKIKKILSTENNYRTKEDIRFLLNEFKHSEYLNNLLKTLGHKAVMQFVRDLDYKEYNNFENNEPIHVYTYGNNKYCLY